MIAKDLEGWRALCNDADASTSRKQTFWSKLPHAPSQAPGKGTCLSQRTRSESSVQSVPASSGQGNEKWEQCSAAPHCPEFDTKHKKKQKMTPERKEQYEYLYAGQAHCLQCLKYYRSLANFDLNCTSSSKGVSQWAQTDEHGKMIRQIPMSNGGLAVISQLVTFWAVWACCYCFGIRFHRCLSCLWRLLFGSGMVLWSLVMQKLDIIILSYEERHSFALKGGTYPL